MTNESAISHRYIPMFEGRSSIGRLGLTRTLPLGLVMWVGVLKK